MAHLHFSSRTTADGDEQLDYDPGQVTGAQPDPMEVAEALATKPYRDPSARDTDRWLNWGV